MRIGFDGKRAVQNFTGLGNYSRYMVEILCRFHPQNEYVLYTPRRRENKRLSLLMKAYPQLSIAYPATKLWQRLHALWRVWGLSRQIAAEGIDMFHGLSNELPLNIRRSGLPSVVTIHDLIFLRYPKYYPFVDRHIYAYKFRRACRQADRIVAISQCTKQDIIRFFGIPEENIEVIYQGCDPSFARPVSPERLKQVGARYGLPQHYILCVGSIEERKNALLAAQALMQLPQEVHLVLVGRRTPYADQIEQYAHRQGLSERIHIIEGISFEDLPAVYQAAEIFVYPSRFEGFGIPIIEALHSGLPVVAATGSCLEEAGGPDSFYVDPDSADQLADAFKRIYADSAFRQQMIERGKVYAASFSEERQAEQLMTLYRRLAQQGGQRYSSASSRR